MSLHPQRMLLKLGVHSYGQKNILSHSWFVEKITNMEKSLLKFLKFMTNKLLFMRMDSLYSVRHCQGKQSKWEEGTQCAYAK